MGAARRRLPVEDASDVGRRRRTRRVAHTRAHAQRRPSACSKEEYWYRALFEHHFSTAKMDTVVVSVRMQEYLHTCREAHEWRGRGVKCLKLSHTRRVHFQDTLIYR